MICSRYWGSYVNKTSFLSPRNTHPCKENGHRSVLIYYMWWVSKHGVMGSIGETTSVSTSVGSGVWALEAACETEFISLPRKTWRWGPCPRLLGAVDIEIYSFLPAKSDLYENCHLPKEKAYLLHDISLLSFCHFKQIWRLLRRFAKWSSPCIPKWLKSDFK